MLSFFSSFHRKSLCRSTRNLVLNCYYFFLFHVNPFWIQLCYFLSVSLFGFLLLKALSNKPSSSSTKDLDMFFTAISAATVSSMSTVEMEVFSNSQLLVLTILMLLGGEVFLSMVGLQFAGSKLMAPPWNNKSKTTTSRAIYVPGHYQSSLNMLHSPSLITNISSPTRTSSDNIGHGNLEMGINVIVDVSSTDHDHIDHDQYLSRNEKSDSYTDQHLDINNNANYDSSTDPDPNFLIRNRAIKLLGRLISTYLVVVQAAGVIFVITYISIFSTAHSVLESKGILVSTFSIFTIVSTFANCGFIPTNENMIIFRNNSGLLLVLITQILLGNTLFPSFLRFFIWALGNDKLIVTKIKEETDYLLRNNDIGYSHLLPFQHSLYLVFTVIGFILVQFLVFCSIEWQLPAFSSLNSYQRVVAVLFQCVNSRHAGESIVDLSIISPAILVLFIVMMYLPPYTCFIPVAVGVEKKEEDSQQRGGKILSSTWKGQSAENVLFSQLSYLAIFVMAICITERESLQNDPLNFTLLNIVVEVISAYGNVGFSSGYSCARRLHPEGNCVDKLYGFSGKWTDGGKILLIMVMVFGRLKKFNMEGGKAWKIA